MASPRPPQQARARRTKGDLLDAARRVFADLGYDGATVDDVVEEAGCSKGAYYFHFASKEEALLALLEEWADRRTTELRDAEPTELLETLLVPETGGGWGPRLVIEFWEQAGRNRRIQQKLASTERSWRRLLEERLAPGTRRGGTATVRFAAQLALALHHGLIVQGCLGQVSRARARECTLAVESVLARPKGLRRAG